MENNIKKIQIYTDGSCLGNPGPGGYAICIVKDKLVSFDDCFSRGENNTTNNRMELQGIILAFEKIEELNLQETQIISDSNYVVEGFNKYINNWINKNWITTSKQPVSNSDLWKIIYNFKQKYSKVEISWTKSHNKNSYNDIVDKLARNEAKKIQKTEIKKTQ